MPDAPSNVHPMTQKFLGKEMYLVITRPVRSPEIEKRLGDHLAHQVELERKGIMFAAGPLYPKGSQIPEAGMFVLRANSFEEAEAIAATDPLHAAGLAHLHDPEMARERRQHHAEGELLRPDRGDHVGWGKGASQESLAAQTGQRRAHALKKSRRPTENAWARRARARLCPPYSSHAAAAARCSSSARRVAMSRSAISFWR